MPLYRTYLRLTLSHLSMKWYEEQQGLMKCMGPWGTLSSREIPSRGPRSPLDAKTREAARLAVALIAHHASRISPPHAECIIAHFAGTLSPRSAFRQQAEGRLALQSISDCGRAFSMSALAAARALSAASPMIQFHRLVASAPRIHALHTSVLAGLDERDSPLG